MGSQVFVVNFQTLLFDHIWVLDQAHPQHQLGMACLPVLVQRDYVPRLVPTAPVSGPHPVALLLDMQRVSLYVDCSQGSLPGLSLTYILVVGQSLEVHQAGCS
jgi:hypothetical protein